MRKLSTFDKYETFRTSKFFKVPALVIPGVTIGDIALAFATLIDTRNKVIQNENRGLHWTDKRTTLDFYKGYPDVSVESIFNDEDVHKLIAAAVKARGKGTSRLTVKEYKRNLAIRSIILQIMNPIHRKDWFLKVSGEKLRKAVLNVRQFIKMASDESNAEYATRFLTGR